MENAEDIQTKEQIVAFVKDHKESSAKEIFTGVNFSASFATFKRILSELKNERLLSSKEKGKATKYILSPLYTMFMPIDMEKYYQKEIDERVIKKTFQFSVLDILQEHNLFTKKELQELQKLQEKFKQHSNELSESEQNKELERLAIDLSWKSSQIEGNTYSLLETEKLLKEKETAQGKTQEEATMLLNHKEALDFIVENPNYLYPLSVAKIEDVHSILIKELSIERNLRKRRVGISGTNYRPLDNEFQINEALQKTCNIINAKENVFEKALLALLLISYIQPFTDGNKRMSRILCNAILINQKYCPLSFRSVDSLRYKKAMLLFYEKTNIDNFKKIFMEQFAFAVDTYF